MAAASTSKQAVTGRLQGMRFMQRAKLREDVLKKQEAEAKGETAVDEVHWVTPAASRGCRVIVEGDPKPGAIVGRMSFQNFNPAVEKIVEEVEARRERLRNEACTSNGQEKATSTTTHVGRNGETSGVTVEVEDVDKMSMRKRQKVETVEKKLEKKLEKITVSSTETSKVTSLSSLRTVVKAEADKHVQRHETKQVKSNRDWRHLRPPGH